MIFLRFQWLLYLGLGGDAAADIYLGITLCYFLDRSRTGSSKSVSLRISLLLEFISVTSFSVDNLIRTLMFYCINTGLLTSVCAIASLVSVNKQASSVIGNSTHYACMIYVSSRFRTRLGFSAESIYRCRSVSIVPCVARGYELKPLIQPPHQCT